MRDKHRSRPTPAIIRAPGISLRASRRGPRQVAPQGTHRGYLSRSSLVRPSLGSWNGPARRTTNWACGLVHAPPRGNCPASELLTAAPNARAARPSACHAAPRHGQAADPRAPAGGPAARPAALRYARAWADLTPARHPKRSPSRSISPSRRGVPPPLPGAPPQTPTTPPAPVPAASAPQQPRQPPPCFHGHLSRPLLLPHGPAQPPRSLAPAPATTLPECRCACLARAVFPSKAKGHITSEPLAARLLISRDSKHPHQNQNPNP